MQTIPKGHKQKQPPISSTITKDNKMEALENLGGYPLGGKDIREIKTSRYGWDKKFINKDNELLIDDSLDMDEWNEA